MNSDDKFYIQLEIEKQILTQVLTACCCTHMNEDNFKFEQEALSDGFKVTLTFNIDNEEIQDEYFNDLRHYRLSMDN